ncbi:MAG TPA: glutaredoxin [Candidatus Enterocloster excrementigallinarum]|uniref:Glutaredoxin n=1 Tax=Candidatus Enterocloster excrementigallinarum TaxID=2838558 RepID=A0A9D2PWQ8_9FIRM|nr:glutaredoxin [Candidatus Enterocloster excrementigallinarum]
MRKITVMGSHLCPDTIYAVNKLVEAGFKVTYKDILSCHSDLREYLMMRDTSPMYEEIRGTETLGVPCFIREDGTKTLDLGEVLEG